VRRLALAVALLACASSLAAYTLSGGGKWVPPSYPYRVNPTNNNGFTAQQVIDVAAASHALWRSATSTIAPVYGGTTTTGTAACTSGTHARNGVNEVLFAPCAHPTNAAVIASTFWWHKADGTALEKDLVFWDARAFYLGSGCTGSSAYVDKIANHEIGHVWGLNHTTTAGSVMLGSYSWCSNTMFAALSSDDIAGIRFLYPPPTLAPPPAAPTALRVS
jgi:hypothetical protein